MGLVGGHTIAGLRWYMLGHDFRKELLLRGMVSMAQSPANTCNANHQSAISMDLQRIAREWVIYGRVQGVGFRAFAGQRARSLGVAGWVANRRDGAVVVMAEGDIEAMRAFEAHLRRGPAMARVDRMDETDRAPEGYAEFQIFPTKESF